jgi:hypothetical protein
MSPARRQWPGFRFAVLVVLISRIAEMNGQRQPGSSDGRCRQNDGGGTRAAPISYLWRFPFDKIKIDRSFMQGAARSDTPFTRLGSSPKTSLE